MNLKSIFFGLLIFLFSADIFAQTSFTYTGKPRFQIQTRRNGVVLGNINVELFPNIAPKHVRNFDSLVSTGFYDTTAFHRCVPGFVIQGGDPNTRNGPISTWGMGQPNQPTVDAEFTVARHVRGSLSAARSQNINSATSQFFICVAPTPGLNGLYSLYGRVTSGINYVDTIVSCPKMSGTYSETPLQKIEMYVSYIGSNDTVPVAPTLTLPVNASPNEDYMFPITLKWNRVNDAVLYEVQLTKAPLFLTVDTTIITPNLNCAMNGLLSNTNYYWRVRANNGGHFSNYSPTWNFKTLRDPDDATGIPGVSLANTVITAFPNPGTGKFNFANLPQGAVIEIFDIAGKSVFTSTIKDPVMTINLERSPKGVYAYRISGPDKPKVEGKLIIE